jgi:hypothetical protein
MLTSLTSASETASSFHPSHHPADFWFQVGFVSICFDFVTFSICFNILLIYCSLDFYPCIPGRSAHPQLGLGCIFADSAA